VLGTTNPTGSCEWEGKAVFKKTEILDMAKSTDCDYGLVQFTAHIGHSQAIEGYLQHELTSANGGTVHNIPFICGGKGRQKTISNKCYMLKDKVNWSSIASMNIARSYYGLAVVNGSILVAGGKGSTGGAMDSVELLQHPAAPVWTKRKQLPKKMDKLCMVSLDDGTVMAIGGRGTVKFPHDWVHIYNISADEWRHGRKMSIPRTWHGCSTLRNKTSGKVEYVIVAGGYTQADNDYPGRMTSSVELYNPTTDKWSKGPELPSPMAMAPLLEDGKGGVLLVGGNKTDVGAIEEYSSNLILHLSGSKSQWQTVYKKLKYPRTKHIAMVISDSITLC